MNINSTFCPSSPKQHGLMRTHSWKEIRCHPIPLSGILTSYQGDPTIELTRYFRLRKEHNSLTCTPKEMDSYHSKGNGPHQHAIWPPHAPVKEPQAEHFLRCQGLWLALVPAADTAYSATICPFSCLCGKERGGRGGSRTWRRTLGAVSSAREAAGARLPSGRQRSHSLRRWAFCVKTRMLLVPTCTSPQPQQQQCRRPPPRSAPILSLSCSTGFIQPIYSTKSATILLSISTDDLLRGNHTKPSYGWAGNHYLFDILYSLADGGAPESTILLTVFSVKDCLTH